MRALTVTWFCLLMACEGVIGARACADQVRRPQARAGVEQGDALLGAAVLRFPDGGPVVGAVLEKDHERVLKHPVAQPSSVFDPLATIGSMGSMARRSAPVFMSRIQSAVRPMYCFPR